MNVIIDASALLAVLRREEGAAEVTEFIQSSTCYIHAVNACEVYYDILREFGEDYADAAMRAIYASGIAFREDMDSDFWRQAGAYKAQFRRISLADCFGLALAIRLGGEFVTADHHEMDAIAKQDICPIRFIR